MMFETFRQDIRVGLRILARERAFCALAVFVLALGIAAVTTQFSVVNAVMLRGFSFPNADRLMNVRFIDPSSTTFFGVSGRILAADFEDFRHEQQSFERLAAYLNGSTVNVTVDGVARRYTGGYVTEDFFRILGVGPIMGRDFTAEDNAAGAPKVALIGHGVWQRDFGGSPDIVGRPVRINGAAATIIGVMPPGFTFPVNEELWIPLYSEFPVRPRNDPRANAPAVLGLIRPGVSPQQAEVEITAFAARLAAAYPETNERFNTGLVEPLIRSFTPPPLRGTLLTMLAFCVGVLLIACVNVMNMQFARIMLRARELAVRSSLGATRGRLIRQVLTESVLLAAGGAVLGIGLAYFAVDWLAAAVFNMETPPPAWMRFDIDRRVLAFTVGAALASAVLAGLLPAWISSRVNAVTVLREGARGSTGGGLGLVTRGLVVLQIVVTCVLLTSSSSSTLDVCRPVLAAQRARTRDGRGSHGNDRRVSTPAPPVQSRVVRDPAEGVHAGSYRSTRVRERQALRCAQQEQAPTRTAARSADPRGSHDARAATRRAARRQPARRAYPRTPADRSVRRQKGTS